jgi:hypothetical protein
MEPPAVTGQDTDGRDLKATFPGNGFVWELWVNSETEDTVVRQRFPNMIQIVGRPQLPFSFVDFERVLQVFVGKRKMTR